MSRMLVELVIKNALKNIKDNPERGIRNLADMALQFSEGGFQKNFLTDIQTMLQNENSAYYELARRIISYTDTDRLYTFGMNAGYNGCNAGAQCIRENEMKLNCLIPWTVIFQIDSKHYDANRQRYQAILGEGEKLGIYVWMLFAMNQPQMLLSLARDYPDSAFCIFCSSDDLKDDFLNEAADLHNIMPVVRYDNNMADTCRVLQERGFLYSAWYLYGQTDTEQILNGNLFENMQQPDPAFAVLVPKPGCPEKVHELVYRTVKGIRSSQTYPAIPYELPGDNNLINSIISDISNAPCSICFDANGNLWEQCRKTEDSRHNLFQDNLTEILRNVCPKKA